MKKINYPPGPSIFSIMAETISSPSDYYQNLMDAYGDVVKIPGTFSPYLVNHAQSLEKILKTNIDNFPKDGISAKPIKDVLGNGLLVLKDAQWLARRKLTAPFFQPNNLKHYVPVIQEKTQACINTWDEYAKTKKSFDIAHELTSIILNITTEVFFDYQLNRVEANKLIMAIDHINKYTSAGLSLLPWLPTISNFHYRRAKNIINRHINAMIDKRKQSPQKKNDLLNVLIHGNYADGKTPINASDLFDEVKTFLVTGIETTAAALSWACCLISSHPKVLEKMQNEVHAILQGRLPEFEDIEKLEYVRMVFEEALRLYPPIWNIARRTKKADKVNDYDIKAKTYVIMCPYSLHRNKNYWDDPEAFIPERHTKQNRDKRPLYSFLPFGGGPRRCIANHFAMQESVMILAMIVQRFNLELSTNQSITKDHYVSMKPHGGVMVNIMLRKYF